ncbi:N-acetylmuramoyl-L-alanine amidase [Clostridium tagluense]|uniref:N-acetylmuramoyl-L-alanine amidase n=1 Tax=Clostridium tagluense TaxID=360422 RepID=UPI001CF52F57|nr:N-acetylmuramoyl-L-alanine amidase [Clostridium tagluense]MCB2298515.1 N-acetylmuramoyl-L-alanine amidase [Clostridium tagluense]
MKNIFKTFIIMIVTFALCIPMQIIVKASTFTDMGSKKDVVVSKPWTVSFNKPLSATTVNTTNIKMVGENNEYIDIKVSLANSNKNVVVEPVKNYEYNKTYTLIVTNQVNSADGKSLPSEVRMNFTTKSAPTKPSEFTVCIDPGQYYKAITGINGVKAKDINLSTALKLGNILKTRGFNVVYTRNSDSVSWNQSDEDEAKAKIATTAKADLFLSINTNSYTSNTPKGIETYYKAGASSNKMLATSIQDELIKATQATNRGIKEASNEANLGILNKISCPAVVLELGFLTNPDEEILLSSAEYQNNEAKAIANGSMNYAGFANSDTNYDSIFKVSSVGDIKTNIEQGGKYIFPKTVQATMSNNSKKDVDVVWNSNSLDTSKAGVYTFQGTIKDSTIKVNLVVNVIATTQKKYKVVLDAGHGGYDPGATGPKGINEKDITLAITLKVGSILVKNGVDTVYTRTSDNIAWSTNEAQNLQARCDISNAAKPDYFVSIHENSFSALTASGIETYYFSGSVAGQKLAQAVQTELIKETGRVDRGLKTTTGLYVIKNVDATSILVETSFISNPEEEKLLTTDAYQYKLAKAIATGILKSLGISNIVF